MERTSAIMSVAVILGNGITGDWGFPTHSAFYCVSKVSALSMH